MTILVTGCAGFIGYHLSKRLLSEGHRVVGLDNLNPYYSVELKKNRLKQLTDQPQFAFHPLDLQEKEKINALFQTNTFDKVIHLAAQAGVRYSLDHPQAYIDANLTGFLSILEACRQHHIQHLVYASSSSVYGANTHYPFSEKDNVDHPVSLYAASKKANELMAHTYAHLFDLPCTGLRFFTVYGPWGRPDMALFKFTKNILEDKPIEVYNYGDMLRDFTYIDDIIEGIVRIIPSPPTNKAPYRIYNIGHGAPIKLMDFIHAIEKTLNKKAILEKLPLQAGDVPLTYADTTLLNQDFGFTPKIGIEEGIKEFVTWYKAYYPL